MVDEKIGEFRLFIGDYIEGFCVFSSHWELLWVCDDFAFDGDRCGWIEKFDGDKDFLCFTGRLTGFSDSELPNSTVIAVTWRVLLNLTSAACAMMRS